MVTNYPRGFTVTRPAPVARAAHAAEEWFAGLMTRLGQLMCGLRGHDQVLRFEQHRVHLLCPSCGHESPGWEIGQQPPRLRFQGDARRHRLRRPSAPHVRPVVVRKTA